MFNRCSQKAAESRAAKDAAFQRDLQEIKARGEANRRQAMKDKDRRAHDLCPWSTGVTLDD